MEKHSPIKTPPPHVPGQSVDAELHRFHREEVLPWVVLVIFAALFAAAEWLRWLGDVSPHPIIATIAATAIAWFGITKAISYRKDIQNLKQGRDGERSVGAELESLRRFGCVVIHDVMFEGFNVDHVVLSTRGIFCIETKTLSKLPGDVRAQYDGERLHIPGLGDYSHALQQAQASAGSLQKLCTSLTGKAYPIQPIVCLPGWFISSKGLSWRYATWVLTSSQVVKLIAGAPESISEGDFRALAHHLNQHIANQDKLRTASS